jgi:hypothetical protein
MASPARFIMRNKDVLSLVASFTAPAPGEPSCRTREFYTHQDVFLPVVIDDANAILSTCEVTPTNRYESTFIQCIYTMTCLVVRLRAEGHAAYSSMRKAYADAPNIFNPYNSG